MSISLVIADDHPIVQDALVHLFGAHNDFKIVAVCRDGDETLRALRKQSVDILILDLRMPGKNGLAVLQELARERLKTRTILLTAEVNQREVTEAVRLGARGLFLKDLAPGLIIQ